MSCGISLVKAGSEVAVVLQTVPAVLRVAEDCSGDEGA